MRNKIIEIYNKRNQNIKEFKYWNILITTFWIILYIMGWLTWTRIKYFITIIIIIVIYKKTWKIIEKIKNKKIKEKSLYRIIKINEKSNIILYIIGRLETGKLRKNIIIKSIMNILIPIKIIIYYIYIIVYRFRTLTMYEIIWKRAYGLILSILIYTNIIEILITELGSRTNLYILIYLIILLMSRVYKKKEKKYQENIINYLYNLDINQILEKRINSNMLCYYVKAKWQEKTITEKLEFLKKYGSRIKVEWLKVLNVETISVLEMENKIKNQDNWNIVYYKENHDLKSTVSDLLTYESELEYLKLLYEKYNEKYNQNLEIVKEHNVEELLEYNSIMLKALLYYIWELKGIVELKIDTENGLELEDLDLELEKEKEKIMKDLELENQRKIYEINLFTNLFGIVYIEKKEKYEKYIKYWKWENTQIKFWDPEQQKIITSNWLNDAGDIRINTINVSKINKEWKERLEKKIEEYKKEYKKGLYLEYLKKL